MNDDLSVTTRMRDLGAVVRVGFPPVGSKLLRSNIIAITLGKRIWIHPRLLETAPDLLEPILRHELVHVEQYRRDGMFCFLIRYLHEYFRGRLAGLSHYEAYERISYEREAYASEGREVRGERREVRDEG